MTSAYTINLNPNITTPVKTGYTFKSGDKGITFNIAVTEMDPTGTSAKIAFHRANGTSVEAALSGQGPTYSYTILGNEFAVPGVVVADVKFYQSTTQRVSTASFVFNVINDTLDGLGGGTAGYSDELETLSAAMEGYIEAFGNLSPINPRGAYNASTAYEPADCVSYNGNSWLCIQPCTGVTPNEGAYWQQVADMATGKADKVNGATAGNFAGLDSSGNLTDSGESYTSLVGKITSHAPQNITSRIQNLVTAIAEQNLEKYGYKIGDYFVGTSGNVYHLADLDTFYGGYNLNAVLNTHHIGIVVDTQSDSQWYTSSSISNVNYKNSTLHSFLSTTALNNIKSDITALFGDWENHLLSHDKLYAKLDGWSWSSDNQRSEYIAALTECQIYGCPIWSGDNYQQGEGNKQLELFRRFNYTNIFGNNSVWLRSIYTTSYACIAFAHGHATTNPVNSSFRAAGLILLK